jgi:hypothetical protein
LARIAAPGMLLKECPPMIDDWDASHILFVDPE